MNTHSTHIHTHTHTKATRKRHERATATRREARGEKQHLHTSNTQQQQKVRVTRTLTNVYYPAFMHCSNFVRCRPAVLLSCVPPPRASERRRTTLRGRYRRLFPCNHTMNTAPPPPLLLLPRPQGRQEVRSERRFPPPRSVLPPRSSPPQMKSPVSTHFLSQTSVKKSIPIQFSASSSTLTPPFFFHSSISALYSSSFLPKSIADNLSHVFLS